MYRHQLTEKQHIGYDFDFQSLDHNKKEEDEPKINANSGDQDEEMGNQPDQPMHAEKDFVIAESNENNKTAQQRGGDAHGNPSKRHKCNFCEYSTDHKGHFNQHLLKHTGEKPHGCKFCPKLFTRKEILLGHMKVHVEEFLFHCPSCLEGFSDKDEKKAHEINCKIHRYECHLCKESFGSRKAHMITHMRVHSGDKPFECKECFKQFTQKCGLNKHLKLHAGPRLFRCSKCNTPFSQKSERAAHEEKCDRPFFKCDVCRKSFGYKSNLINHMRTHSGERPFGCQQCLKRFQWKYILNMHMKSHTKKLSFKCSICRQGFAKQTQCKTHEKNCNRRSYECHLCPKFFGSYKTQLEMHMRTHSGDKPFQCQLCQNKFTQKSSFKRHLIRIHNETR